MLPPPARGLGHPGEHKGSYLHCGFQAPHCFPVWGGSKGRGALQVELPPASRRIKGKSGRPEEHAGAEYLALFGRSSQGG